MNTFDFSPLYRSTIGFDRFANLLDNVTQSDTGTGYPPYNIERVNESDYRITLALAGFSEDELSIEVKENTLTLTGSHKQPDESAVYLHQGIAARNFERRFQLADYVRVADAKLENGLLHIDLVREIPEEKKPRRIEIGSGGKRTIEGKKAA